MTFIATGNVLPQIDELGPDELGLLSTVALQVIAKRLGARASDFTGINRENLLTRVQHELSIQDQPAAELKLTPKLMQDLEAERTLARRLLYAIAKVPALASETERLFLDRRKMMTLEPSSIVAFALLLAVLKLQTIQTPTVVIRFASLKTDAIKALASIVAK